MSNLTKRVLSALILIPVSLSFILFSPNWLFSLFIVFISLLVGFEYGTITLGPSFRPYRILVSVLSGLLTASLAFSSSFSLAPFLALFLIVVFCPVFLMFGRSEFNQSVLASACCTSGSLYSGLLTGFIALLYVSHSNGNYWVLTLFFAAVLSDTGAYFIGRAFGRRKFTPRISPNKTWAGAFGGLLGTCIAVTLSKLFFLTVLTWLDVLVLAVPLSGFLQLGDLAESFLKRGFGIKDSGTIIPGHGGVLDRLDAMLVGAPVVFFFSMLK
jgi:phosphatidate cytidylyltransferase